MWNCVSIDCLRFWRLFKSLFACMVGIKALGWGKAWVLDYAFAICWSDCCQMLPREGTWKNPNEWSAMGMDGEEAEHQIRTKWRAVRALLQAITRTAVLRRKTLLWLGLSITIRIIGFSHQTVPKEQRMLQWMDHRTVVIFLWYSKGQTQKINTHQFKPPNLFYHLFCLFCL